jgi:hypothetical protein
LALLQDWDFSDPSTNGTTSQVNRQKSARNLTVVSLDPSVPSGVFSGGRGHDTHAATLDECDCHDFNFVGQSPRKSFKPCMHIYRLAMELGRMEARYLDHRALRGSHGGGHEREHWIAEQNEAETLRLRALPRDASQWGGWNRAVHDSGVQKNRQYRAYHILDDEGPEDLLEGSVRLIHRYITRLDSCSCRDFVSRRLPCKHIYAAALTEGLDLPLTLEQYREARAKGLEVVFDFWESAHPDGA